MKKLLLLLGLFVITGTQAQQLLTTAPGGGNKKAMTRERIGITDVTLTYDRPGVKGREGKIWGQLVPAGFVDQGFGSAKEAPWRAGANENTTITFSSDVKIENEPLAAGKYGFFIAYGKDECTLIFSKNSNSWGSFYYNPKEDVLRVKVKPVTTDRSVEWLKYEFSNQTEDAAVISLLWEKLAIPFRVQVDLNKTQVESFRNELRTDKGFLWMPWQQAAQWCADHNTNLEEALQWADTATNPRVLGDRNFVSLSTKADILAKLNRNPEAIQVMKEAMPLGTMSQVHQYARRLLQQHKNAEALEAFKINYEKNPNQFTTYVGMVRGYSAVGDYKKALEFAEKGLPLAPNEQNKNVVEKMIGQLKEGKDVN